MVFGALRVGLTGLRVNQRFLDVIGNNLTNSETAGFKADRITFSDVLYQTSREPTGPSGSLGGVNARQVGLGTQIGSVDQLHSQGALLTTGRTFDLAIQGNGFFVVNDGSQNLFTRAGALTLDRDSNLVDARTGFRVQDVAGQSIMIDQSSVAPASATSSITLAGNLPAKVSGPLAEIQESVRPYEDHQPATATSTLAAGSTVDLTGTTLSINVDSGAPVPITFTAADFPSGPRPLSDIVNLINSKLTAQSVSSVSASLDASSQLQLVTSSTGLSAGLSFSGTAATPIGLNGQTGSGTEATADATTPLNDLSANTTDYVAGDTITISGVNTAGQAANVTFVFGAANDGETLGDLVNKIQTTFPGTTVALNAGNISVTANQTGETDLSIVLQDGVGNVGDSNFVTHAFDATVDGTGPDTRATSITVFDSLGISHTLNGVFTRQDDGSWDLDLTADDSVITGSPITGVTFANDGTLQGASASSIDIAFTNGSAVQTIDLDFGEIGGLSGLTQFGETSTAQAVSQNGTEAGSLVSLGVTQSGVIQGFYGNGAIVDLATIGIANFQNEAGLLKEGSTLFKRSDNSGQPLIGEAGIGGAGNLVSGALEGSNVDTAEEFVRLIEAQRSFQGSARIVTTADEIFAELLQIV